MLTDRSIDQSTRQGGESMGTVLVSGVYGGLERHRFIDSGDVVLVAGGIGVTPVIAVFREALDTRYGGDRDGDRGDDDNTQIITFVWAIRSLELLELPVVRDVLAFAKSLPANDGVNVHIHLTGPAGRRCAAAAEAAAAAEDGRGGGGRGDDDGDGDDELFQLPADEGAVRFHACRPNFEKLFSEMPESDGGFAFACGPTRLQECVTEHATRFGFTDVHTETFEF